jgi:hypothetical protein
MLRFQFSGNVFNFAVFAFHLSGKEVGQEHRPGPIHRTVSSSSDKLVLGGNQTSDPAFTLNKNIPDVSDPVHQHLINDGL